MTSGAVLAGGASRRMGTDKAFVEVDGVPMGQRVARALEDGGCDPVSFVGGDAVLLARLGRPVHPDRYPGEGPLGGVLSALATLAPAGVEADDAAAVVVAACDLPLLDGPTVARLLDAAGKSLDADAVVARSSRREPALALWRARARPAVEAQWAAGVRALHVALAGLRVVEVPVEEGPLRNVNTIADLSATTRRST